MRVKLSVFILLALLLVLCANVVYAQIPSLPHVFYGVLEINGSGAPVGTMAGPQKGYHVLC